MHSDQMRNDGISEPMIQALYYDFGTNYVKTRMYSMHYVECNSGDIASVPGLPRTALLVNFLLATPDNGVQAKPATIRCLCNNE